MPAELYFASTPLHILNSVAIASERKADCYLLLIDQPDTENNDYFNILSNLNPTTFQKVWIFPGRIKGHWQKLKSRKETFARLDDIISQRSIDAMFIGNDRRIEFQYAMHSQHVIHGKTARGAYMDEGTFTYVGRKASASFSDRIIDNYLKKLTYGSWWSNPPTIGGSEWITDVYAAFPDKVHHLLQSKNLIDLKNIYRDNKSVVRYCETLAGYFGAEAKELGELEAVLTLPHESIIDAIPGYKDSMLKMLDVLQSRGVKTGVKYHPRNTNPDILNAGQREDTQLLPYRIPFEAILPLLKQPLIIGDVSSTLINAAWLKPDARIISIANPSVPLYDEFVNFFASIGVKTTAAGSIESIIKSAIE